MKITNTISQHLKMPNISLRSYLKHKQLELARTIQPAKKVYLDTKFWLLLRDARLGRNVGSDTVALLDLLEAGAANGKIICPISADTYVEIFQQTDRVTLRACAQLIDDLSKGVAIILLMERINLEVAHFIRRTINGPGAVHAVEELIWTKIPYALGFNTRVSEYLPPDSNLAMQKAWLDQLWAITAADMLDMTDDSGGPLTTPFPDISHDLNRGKTEHRDENKSFKQTFLSELWGALDLYKPDFADILAYMCQEHTGQEPPTDEGARQEGGRLLAELIYNAFRVNKLTSELPSLWIGAGLHASVRWNATRKFKANDMPDFRHAVAAVPYCDYFLTERSLRHLISDRNLRLEALFPCKAFSDPPSAVEALAPICK